MILTLCFGVSVVLSLFIRRKEDKDMFMKISRLNYANVRLIIF